MVGPEQWPKCWFSPSGNLLLMGEGSHIARRHDSMWELGKKALASRVGKQPDSPWESLREEEGLGGGVGKLARRRRRRSRPWSCLQQSSTGRSLFQSLSTRNKRLGSPNSCVLDFLNFPMMPAHGTTHWKTIVISQLRAKCRRPHPSGHGRLCAASASLLAP